MCIRQRRIRIIRLGVHIPHPPVTIPSPTRMHLHPARDCAIRITCLRVHHVARIPALTLPALPTFTPHTLPMPLEPTAALFLARRRAGAVISINVVVVVSDAHTEWIRRLATFNVRALVVLREVELLLIALLLLLVLMLMLAIAVSMPVDTPGGDRTRLLR